MEELTNILDEHLSFILLKKGVKTTDRRTLPAAPGIYYVFDECRLLYIGQSKNIYQRWCTHQLIKTLLIKYPNAVIKWDLFEDILEGEFDKEKLRAYETEMITLHTPLLNKSRLIRDKNSILAFDPAENFNDFVDLDLDFQPIMNNRRLIFRAREFCEKGLLYRPLLFSIDLSSTNSNMVVKLKSILKDSLDSKVKIRGLDYGTTVRVEEMCF